MLDATVNDGLDDNYYSSIYLKYTNVGSDTTLRNSICMFRGITQVARENNIPLSSAWECETKKGTFPEMEAVLSQTESNPARGYLLTRSYQLPTSWEKVRFLCTPVADASGNIIGVCGFEINSPFFQSAYTTSGAEQEFMVCALLDNERNAYTGQFAPNQSGYIPPIEDLLTITSQDSLSVFSDGNMSLIGKTEALRIGSSSHTVAVMLPEVQYQRIVHEQKTTTILLFLIVVVIAILISICLSRHYVRPLHRFLDQIKAKQFKDGYVKISELDDLCNFLAKQDSLNESALAKVNQEKADALTTIRQMQHMYDEANNEIKRLAYSRKDEVDPYDYECFKSGLSSLTAKETEVFNLYLANKSVKEILDILHLKESTVRFHTKNIYSKLGIHSLKQLLRYAAILRQEESS